jgi:hypothetical protein
MSDTFAQQICDTFAQQMSDTFAQHMSDNFAQQMSDPPFTERIYFHFETAGSQGSKIQ